MGQHGHAHFFYYQWSVEGEGMVIYLKDVLQIATLVCAVIIKITTHDYFRSRVTLEKTF